MMASTTARSAALAALVAGAGCATPNVTLDVDRSADDSQQVTLDLCPLAAPISDPRCQTNRPLFAMASVAKTAHEQIFIDDNASAFTMYLYSRTTCVQVDITLGSEIAVKYAIAGTASCSPASACNVTVLACP